MSEAGNWDYLVRVFFNGFVFEAFWFCIFCFAFCEDFYVQNENS